jgi:hypothetical protein
MTGFYDQMEMVYKPELEKLRRDAERYRRLGLLVEVGSWSAGMHVIKDKWGATEDTFIDDRAHLNELLDSPEVIAEYEAWEIAYGRVAAEQVESTAQEHQQTDQCGFDRNGSHTEGRYTCTCGWTAPTSLNAVSDDYSLTEVQDMKDKV